MNAQPQALEKNPVKALLTQDVMKKKFEEVLGERAPQFMASISNIGSQMKDVEPMSIIAASFIAATLDLPIDKNLGFAHIVPYNSDMGDGNKRKVAQFQMGYKGFIQLALRTGLYERMNAKEINAEAFGGYDEVGEPRILWEKIDPTKPVAGYAFAWKLTNGFTKVIYWTKEATISHAKKYSQAYKRGKKDSPWFTDPDAMGLKTVIKDGLSHWGILSIQMQRAIVHDQGTQQAIGGTVDYIDGELETGEVEGQSTEQKGKLAKLTDKARADKQAKEATELRELIEAKLLATGSDEAGMNEALKAASISEDGHKWLQLDNLSTCDDPQTLRDILKNLEGPF